MDIFKPWTFYIGIDPSQSDDFCFKGVPNFVPELNDLEEDTINNVPKDHVNLDLNSNACFTCKLDNSFSEFDILRITGIYDWVIYNCPNRKVVHLIKYSRSYKVRKKNFKRAVRILYKEIMK